MTARFTRSFAPKALLGMIVGNAAAAAIPVVERLKKLRRDIPFPSDMMDSREAW